MIKTTNFNEFSKTLLSITNEYGVCVYKCLLMTLEKLEFKFESEASTIGEYLKDVIDFAEREFNKVKHFETLDMEDPNKLVFWNWYGHVDDLCRIRNAADRLGHMDFKI